MDRRDFIKKCVDVSALAVFSSYAAQEACSQEKDQNIDLKAATFRPENEYSNEKTKSIKNILEFLNPTLINAVLPPLMMYRGVSHIINKNLKAYDEKNISKEKLIYNNADKYSGLVFEFFISTVPYLVRISSSSYIKENTSLGAKELSDVQNVNAQHLGSLMYVYFYNPFQAELRKIYIDLLSAEDQYKNDPRNIPISKIASTLQEKRLELDSDIPNQKNNTLSSFSKLIEHLSTQEKEDRVTVPYAIKRDLVRCLTPRGVIDLMSVGLSYPATMYGNFDLGKIVSTPARFAWYTRDMLERIQKQGQPQAHLDEEFQSALSYFINSTSSHLYGAGLQGGLDYLLGLKKHSQKSLAVTNLRELIGTSISWFVYYKIQGNLEPKIRASVEKEPQPRWIQSAYDYLRP